MDKDQLATILIEHNLWVKDSQKGNRADLYGANLYGANLYGANLYGANLSGANLSGANLYGAKLYDIIGKTILTFSAGRHTGYATKNNLQLGCLNHDWDTWLTTYAEIGETNLYSKKEIREYGILIRQFHKKILRLTKDEKDYARGSFS